MTSPVASTRPHVRWHAGTVAADTAQRTGPPDATRGLQLALASVWLLDAVLQFQSFMFGHGFAAMIRSAAPGNPAVVADPINWSAHVIDQHAVIANAAFAVIQLLIGLGIAWRPAVKPALVLSVLWSLAVWWLGEGLGGLLAGSASPVNGAPGAVILYGLLAILLWPRSRTSCVPFAAARCTGAAVARALWLVLWGTLAVLALMPATRAPRAISSMITGTFAGQPAWLVTLDTHLAVYLGARGPEAAILLAAVLVVIAAGIYLPRRAVTIVLALAIAVAAALWLGQGLGGIMTGSGTDPDTGPLLALLALAYWPLRSRPDAPGAGVTAGPAAGSAPGPANGA